MVMANQLSGVEIVSSKKSRRQRSARDHLIDLVELIVTESGSSDKFDARSWLKEWLVSANPALGNRTPAEFMRTKAGRETIRSLILQMQNGAYA